MSSIIRMNNLDLHEVEESHDKVVFDLFNSDNDFVIFKLVIEECAWRKDKSPIIIVNRKLVSSVKPQ